MRTTSIILLTAGLVVLGFGFREMDTFSSEFVEFFTGEPSEEAMALLIAGGISALLGVLGLVFGKRLA